ncbi:hypothetical protein TPHA_0J01200 [Tetrapisispora phaffii CBS 4417]|uniref:DUF1746 domain-containing protein n=1 Tax=Tetrapisispora phaffii (strain ATCC 24235 / CBS 4417 / NBRC 1672 / NRRL Y-8282 / UCD 70-5) TaxID=1071381 RepID=G8BYK0_TETPH|nr:hypothetical protein TPHA_0J01200 [Tetrapisispora phaffii CBS 4417]CCE64942.1 hypothetical protein TPHA_0J01200 [Tetrapisispora phaffii CBS 4417]
MENMSSDRREENLTNSHDSERVYKLRKKNFQKRLTSQLIFFGYVCITFQYIKYGTSFFVLLYRCLLQSILTAPYPSDSQLRRITENALSRENESDISTSSIPYINNNLLQYSLTGANVEMPGSFDEGISGTASPSEQSIQDSIENLKLRARKYLFHWSFTFNLMFILWDFIFPVDFLARFDGENSPDDRFKNLPSPYINGHGLLGGEKSYGIFVQMIGQAMPDSNLKGNIGLILTDILILCCQYSLFILTAINFASFKNEELNENDVDIEHERLNFPQSNGYDGRVLVTKIDPVNTVSKIIKGSTSQRSDYSSV